MDKRIIEETPSTEVLNDDWFIKDSPTGGTSKILGSELKDAFLGDTEDAIDKILGSIAPKWSSAITYGYNAYVIYEGELWRCFKDTGSTRGEFKTSEWIKGVTSGYITHVVNKIANRFVASNPPYMTYSYSVGDMVFYSEPYHEEQLYVCNTDLPQGESTFNPGHWDVVYTVAGLSKYLMDKIAEAGQIDDVQIKTTGDYESVVDENKVAKIDLSNMLIEKSVPNLPQPIASFSDGSDLPLKSLTASIEPVQDLHGYDSPWPAGGGKNKLVNASDSYSITQATYHTYNINPAIPSGTTVTFSIDSNLVSNKRIMLYNDNSSSVIKLGERGEQSVTFTTDAELSIFRMYIGDYDDNATTINKAQLEIGSTVTTYSPYSNICLITGWSGVNVNVTANLFDKEKSREVLLPFLQGQTIYVMQDSANTFDLYIGYNDNTSDSFTMEPNTKYQFTFAKDSYGVGITQSALNVLISQNKNMMVSLNDFTNIVPFGTTTTIPFTDGQGQSVTVYGGSIDIVSPTCKVEVDRHYFKVGDVNWTYVNAIKAFRYQPSIEYKSVSGSIVPTKLLCSTYKTVSNGNLVGDNTRDLRITLGVSGSYDKNIIIRDLRYNNASTFKSEMADVEICYERKTIVEYAQIPTPINSLEGGNNIWADTGDVTELEYIANATDVIANLEARVAALES